MFHDFDVYILGDEIENLVQNMTGTIVNKGETSNRLSSEGTLSPCESIASDDLMLDYEVNSFDETAGRSVKFFYQLNIIFFYSYIIIFLIWT